MRYHVIYTVLKVTPATAEFILHSGLFQLLDSRLYGKKCLLYLVRQVFPQFIASICRRLISSRSRPPLTLALSLGLRAFVFDLGFLLLWRCYPRHRFRARNRLLGLFLCGSFGISSGLLKGFGELLDGYALELCFLLCFFEFDGFVLRKVLQIFRVVVRLICLRFRSRMILLWMKELMTFKGTSQNSSYLHGEGRILETISVF